MKKVNAILSNKNYIYNLQQNSVSETDREFCRHDMNHFLDVARIAYIKNLEENLGYNKEMIYAAALLHDIGKWKQYKHDIPHSRASADIAKEILEEAGFEQAEVTVIVEAVLKHSDYSAVDLSFNYLLYKSDKLSRKCYHCPVSDGCKWDAVKKNKEIEV